MAASWAIVTGGGSGLGLALAEGLGRAGISVAILGRDPHRLGEALGRLRAGGADSESFVCDVSKQADVDDAFSRISHDRQVRFLFNVAGAGRFGPVEELTDDAIEEVLSGNLKGLMIATVAALPILRTAAGGTIVTVLSSAALVGRPNEAAYCAAKWGGRGFMESLRAALKGSSIRTLTVYPGGMRTPFWDSDVERPRDLETYMDPHDVAAQILRVALEPAGAHVTELTIARG